MNPFKQDKCFIIQLTTFSVFKVLQKELENWRSSNYSAISREFADNARFVFRSLEERSLHGNYITDRPEGKVTDSVGARRAEQILHFRTFPFLNCFFFGPLTPQRLSEQGRKATHWLGGRSFRAATLLNQAGWWTRAFPVRPFQTRVLPRHRLMLFIMI